MSTSNLEKGVTTMASKGMEIARDFMLALSITDSSDPHKVRQELALQIDTALAEAREEGLRRGVELGIEAAVKKASALTGTWEVEILNAINPDSVIKQGGE
jgi:hypothetical protein